MFIHRPLCWLLLSQRNMKSYRGGSIATKCSRLCCSPTGTRIATDASQQLQPSCFRAVVALPTHLIQATDITATALDPDASSKT